MIIYIYTK